MKKTIFLVIILLQVFLLSSCSANQELTDEMEQLKIEYAIYDQYKSLIDALENKDYDLAEKLLAGYKSADYNAQLQLGNVQEIVITTENWSEYFEVKKLTEWTENDFGEATGFITHVYVVVSDAYTESVDWSRLNVSFEWSAMCSVKNCTVDLVNHMVSYENVFKSNSTTFGDPEKLTGTVSFQPALVNDTFANNHHAVAEIGEIVIVGEYLLGAEMKPVCFDYDEISISQAEGIMYLLNNGE